MSTTTVDITIAPNQKYKRVIGLFGPDQDEDLDEEIEDDMDDWEDWPDEHKEAADNFVELVDTAPTPENYDSIDREEQEMLSWDHVNPASDPDLLSKIATYFDGMTPDEPKDVLRAKCRLLDVEIYVDAQVAAREELRD